MSSGVAFLGSCRTSVPSWCHGCWSTDSMIFHAATAWPWQLLPSHVVVAPWRVLPTCWSAASALHTEQPRHAMSFRWDREQELSRSACLVLESPSAAALLRGAALASRRSAKGLVRRRILLRVLQNPLQAPFCNDYISRRSVSQTSLGPLRSASAAAFHAARAASREVLSPASSCSTPEQHPPSSHTRSYPKLQAGLPEIRF